MKLQTKKLICLLVAIISILTFVSAVSYAYFSAVADVTAQDVALSTGTMRVRFADANNGISATLKFEEHVSKKFTIENYGTLDATVQMYWEELINTYTNGSLTYTLSYSLTEEGSYTPLITDRNVPISQNPSRSNLATDLRIPANTTYYYDLVITLNYLDKINQDADIDAMFNTKFALGNDKLPSESEKTLAVLGVTANTDGPDFTQEATTNEGVFSMEDDYGTSYYYRGAVENNYVRFGQNKDGQDMYWRIIRVNGDGTLRVIYDGTSAHANGEESEDRVVGRSQWNNKYDDSKYVGYMFGGANGEASTSKAQAQTNTTDSTMKTYLDTWYEENIIATGNSSYVADVLFCNDRSTVETPSSWGELIGIWNDTQETGLGYAKNVTVFGYWNRIIVEDEGDTLTGANPTLKCPQKNDAFTVNDTKVGNKALTYPIGLITADEANVAGSAWYENSDFYLYKGSWYWMFSPAGFAHGRAFVSRVFGGRLGNAGVGSSGAVAPVINLSSGFVQNMIGEGTMTNPYHL